MEKEPIQDDIAEKLQQELTMRGQFYFKGFGMILSDLFVNLEIFAVTQATNEIAEHIHHRLKTITDLYNSIPFDQITAHPDFDLLVTIRDAISLLHPAIQKIINGAKDISEAERIITIIHDNGQAYRTRLAEILTRLRQEPGHENDGLRSIDVINNKVWDSAI